MSVDFLKRIRWVALGLVVVLSATLAFGQGIVTGSISGVVLDPQKAVIPNAKVAAKNVATGVELKTTTNNVGYFAFNSVPIGTYTVTVDAQSFTKLELGGVNVNSSTNTDMGTVALTVGSRAETVTVEATTPLIETTAVQGGGTFDAQKVADLPISNAFDDLAFFVPGVSTVGSQGFSNTNGEAFAVNGQRGRNNNFQIDGQANNDNSVAGPALFYGNQDTIAELRIITNDPDVSYGRNSGATVNYVTKSGTNNYHGTAFEYYTGNFAQSLGNNEKNPLQGFCAPGQTPSATNSCIPVGSPPRFVENRYGGTLGGPIIPNKIWFFGSYMEDVTRTSGSTITSQTVTPTPAGVAMLNAAYPNNPAVNFLNTFGPYAYSAGNPRPSGTPQNLSVSDGATTLNNVPFSFVQRNAASPANDWEAGGRVDFQITPKDLFFTRYYYQKTLSAVVTVNADDVPAGQWANVNSNAQQIALDWTRTFTDHFVNQIRFNYQRATVNFGGGSNPNCTISSLHACPTDVLFEDGTTMLLGLDPTWPQGRLINNSQWQDNASLVKGRHTFKFGGEYDRQRSPNVFLPNTNGIYRFADFNAFLQNAPDSLGLTNGPASINYKEQDASLYFSDEWRLKDNFTLTVGLRWEYWQQAYNELSRLSIATQTGPNPFWNTSLPLDRTTLPPVPNDTNNFGPSIGFAWTPRIFKGIFGENKTVIRAGYRISYDPAFYNMFLNTAQAAPVVNAGTILGSSCTAPCFPTSGFTGADVQAGHLQDIPAGVDPGTRTQSRVPPNFHNPYVQTWTFGVQREFTSKIAAEVRYVGSHTVGEFQTLNGNPSLLGLNQFNADAAALGIAAPNPLPAGVTACPTATTNGIPNPGFANEQVLCNFRNVSLRANTAFSSYNALQTELKVRRWHGVTSGVSYTWSKTMDNASEIFNTAAGGQTIAQAQNPFDFVKGERSLSGLDFPHVVSVYMLYETPWFQSQKGLLGHVLGGWQFNTTYRYTPGELWTPRSFRAPFGGSDYCDVTYARTLPSSFQRCRSFLGNPAAPFDTVGQCTDPTAPDCGLIDFMSGAPTTMSAVHWIYNDDNAALFFKTPYGMRRNPGVRGDPVNTVNFSLYKNLKVSERMNFRLEAQVYNLFNTSYLGVPGTWIDQGNASVGGPFGNTAFNSPGGQDFGSINATGLGVRTMILGAKIVF